MASNLATIRVELIANAQKFKTSLDKASTSLKKVDKSTIKTGKGASKLQAKMRDVAGSIAAVQGPLGPVAGRLNAIGAIMGRVSLKGLAMTGAFVAAGFALTKLIKNVTAVQTQMLKLEGILKATGGAAGLSLSEIENLSTEIGIATLASTSKVRDAAGIMLTFKSITGDAFKDALRLAQDLAEVGFGDLKMGATQLGKALEDPIVGLGALRRVGVSFTDAQKEMIKVLTMTGRKAEAQRIILDALDQQVGGAGVKAATGLAGAVDSLREKLDIFFERSKLGVAIVNGLTKSINFLADAFGNVDIEAKKLTTIKQVTDELKEMKAEMATLNNEDMIGAEFNENDRGTKDQQRYAELQKLIEEHKKQLDNLISVENRKAHKESVITKEKVKEDHMLRDIQEKNARIHERTTDRQIKAFGKTQAELKDLNDIYKIQDELRKKLGSDGKLSEAEIAEQMKIATKGIMERNAEYQKFADIQRDLDAVAKGVGSTFASVGDKISDAMFRGKLHTLDFKNILYEMVIALQKMIFKVMVLDQIQRKIEERMSKGGINFGSILKAFIPGSDKGVIPGEFAGGGTVQQGSPTLVGERGPELFVPNGAGKIVNGADTKSTMGGGGVSVVQNLNFAVGITNTVRAEVMNMLPAIQQSTISAVADAKQRGGKFSKAFGA